MKSFMIIHDSQDHHFYNQTPVDTRGIPMYLFVSLDFYCILFLMLKKKKNKDSNPSRCPEIKPSRTCSTILSILLRVAGFQ